jgi:membrane-associated phospholipid phosphatase
MHIFFYIPFPDWLVKFDRQLFYDINIGQANGFFDRLMPLMRNPFFWSPLYLFLAVFAIFNFKKKGLWWILFFVFTAACTDLIGTHIFKYNFARLRPCNDPVMMAYVRMVLNRCSGGFSFVSNHAINHFGMAAFSFMTFRGFFHSSWIFFVWAAIVAYAQVYVGVHFPFDVIGGAFMGTIIGLATGTVFNKNYRFIILEPSTATK